MIRKSDIPYSRTTPRVEMEEIAIKSYNEIIKKEEYKIGMNGGYYHRLCYSAEPSTVI